MYIKSFFFWTLIICSSTYGQSLTKSTLIGNWTHTRRDSIVEKIAISDGNWEQEFYTRKKGKVEILVFDYEYEIQGDHLSVIASRKKNGKPQEYVHYLIKSYDGNRLSLYQCSNRKCNEGRHFVIVRE
jgi:hypothetical protein